MRIHLLCVIGAMMHVRRPLARARLGCQSVVHPREHDTPYHDANDDSGDRRTWDLTPLCRTTIPEPLSCSDCV